MSESSLKHSGKNLCLLSSEWTQYVLLATSSPDQTNLDFSSGSCRGPFQKSASEGPSCASLLSESVNKIKVLMKKN